MKKLLWVILIFVLIFSFLIPGKIARADDSDSWTLLFYMDGDNNLEESVMAQLNYLEYTLAAQPCNQVKIVALVDRMEGYSSEGNAEWSDAKIFEVLADKDASTINSKVLCELGEVNMGNPETLKNFIVYSTQAYPAKHYVLFLVDHGNGVGGLCFDDTDRDLLTLPELKKALDEAKKETGETFDIINFDCCAMGVFEVAYIIKDYAKFMVASQTVEYALSEDIIVRVFQKLLSDPEMTPEELGKLMVKEYYWILEVTHVSMESGIPNITKKVIVPGTHSLINLEKLSLAMSPLRKISKEFVSATKKEKIIKLFWPPAKTPYLDFLNKMREEITTTNNWCPIEGPIPELQRADIDVCDFADRIEKANLSPNLNNLAKELKSGLNSAILSSNTVELSLSGIKAPPLNGLSIRFFVNENEWEYINTLDFPREWIEFLKAVNSTGEPIPTWHEKMTNWFKDLIKKSGLQTAALFQF